MDAYKTLPSLVAKAAASKVPKAETEAKTEAKARVAPAVIKVEEAPPGVNNDAPLTKLGSLEAEEDSEWKIYLFKN